uniref:Calmodulin n=1 Tax=Erythrolobus australicus TaxID=1077150 RepID=A0A7S1TM11_9RHOD
MGQTFAKVRVDQNSAAELFAALDSERSGVLTLAELLHAAPSVVLLHSLPALYFLDKDKDGRYSREEFAALVRYLQTEKTKVKQEVARDAGLRKFLQHASEAGVVDSSIHGRCSFRRLTNMRNIRSLYRNEETMSRASSAARLAEKSADAEDGDSVASSVSSHACVGGEAMTARNNKSAEKSHVVSMYCTAKEYSTNAFDDEDHASAFEPSHLSLSSPEDCTSRSGHENVSCWRGSPSLGDSATEMSTSVFTSKGGHDSKQAGEGMVLSLSALERMNVRSLDAAVAEKITISNIKWLAEHLRQEGMREQFMQWLWNLANVHNTAQIGAEELALFLEALSEDEIDLEELVFDRRTVCASLQERILLEFGGENATALSSEEFFVFADLVTSEYEYWEDRHLECIGQYELGRILGRGSSAIVRAAVSTDDHSRYAVKIVKKGRCSDLSRLDREIQSLHIMSEHSNIVKLVEVLENDESLFLVMELCGGGSLIDILRLYPEERLPENVARYFMRQLFEALAVCHENGVCHRDVRLENMLLSNEGVLKLTDFGHSGLYTPGWDIFQTSLVGSIFNLSPEQVRGSCYSGEKIDAWSAGIALYILLVGRPPFYDTDNTRLLSVILAGEYELPMFVSDEAFDLLQWMIRVDPEERGSFRDLLAHEWFDGPVTAPIMDLVTMPIQAYYRRHSEVAEVAIASVFQDHTIHVHLAGSCVSTESLAASHEEENCAPGASTADVVVAPDWKLMCSSLSLGIKFSVSLFTETSPINRQIAVTSSESVVGDVRIGDVFSETPPCSAEAALGASGMLATSISGFSLGNAFDGKLSRDVSAVAEVDLSRTGRNRRPALGHHRRASIFEDINWKNTRSNISLPSAKLHRNVTVCGDMRANEPRSQFDTDEEIEAALRKNLTKIKKLVNEFPAKRVAPVVTSPKSMACSPAILPKRRCSLPDIGDLQQLKLLPSQSDLADPTPAYASPSAAAKSGACNDAGRSANAPFDSESGCFFDLERDEAAPMATCDQDTLGPSSAEHQSLPQQVTQMLWTEPHLELRLIEGDSCVFLKVCRKLKAPIYEKLEAAACTQHRQSRRGCASMKRIFSDAHFAHGVSASSAAAGPAS